MAWLSLFFSPTAWPSQAAPVTFAMYVKQRTAKRCAADKAIIVD